MGAKEFSFTRGKNAGVFTKPAFEFGTDLCAVQATLDGCQVSICGGVIEVIAVGELNIPVAFDNCRAEVFVTLYDHKLCLML